MTQSTAEIPISETIAASITFPPGDLWSDEPELESDLHREQIDLLIRLIKGYWRERSDFYAAGNLTVYYSPNQRKSEFFRGPDFFVVLGTEKKDRKSWVVWQEDGRYPNIIVELLSDSTANMDQGLKKEIYQNIWRVPDYFWFDPYTLELQGFHLLDGQYQPLEPTAQGWLWSEQISLYLGADQGKLRFFTSDGQLVPSPEEAEAHRANQAEQRANQAEQQAEQERQQRQQLLEKLKTLSPEQLTALGITPDELQ